MALSKDYEFESQRLRFRGIQRDDADTIVTWRSNPANYRNFLDATPATLKGHLEWFEGYLSDSSRYDFLILEGERPIGTCGLSSIGSDACEIGYMIGDISARGKGYATEALRRLAEVAFDELGVSYVDARILPHNEASIKVALGGGVLGA